MDKPGTNTSTAIMTAKTTRKTRPRHPRAMPSACLHCGSGKGYQPRTEPHPVPFKGEEFELDCTDVVCLDCGDALVPDGELDRRLKALVRLYQEKHGLLTGEDLRTRRQKLGHATQESFVEAAQLVSIATLKRLEAGGCVQEPATDRILRDELDRLEQEAENRFQQTVLRKTLFEIPETKEAPMVWRPPGSLSSAFQLAACLTLFANGHVLTTVHTPPRVPSHQEAQSC